MSEKKLLFITFNDIEEIKTGGEYISNRNYLLLKKNIKMDTIIITKNINSKKFKLKIPKSSNKIETFLYLLTGRFTYNKKYEELIIEKISKEKYNYIFLDSSLFGFLCEKIKKNFPAIKIITFFHNIEFNFIKSRAKIENKIYYIMSFFGYINEKKIIKYSDKVIVLNQREKMEMEKIYKKRADYILPLSFEDKFDKNMIKKYKEISYLFLGSYFYANYEGILWFIKNVLPNVKGTLYIVGKDFEKVRDKLEKYERVKIIGTVESTSEWYYKIPVVISPIFSGAGMKTKIAEALMYGKYIFGTTEAFEGYNLEYNKVGDICNTKEEFITSLKKIESLQNIESINKYSREYYLKEYSWNSTEINLKKILNEI